MPSDLNKNTESSDINRKNSEAKEVNCNIPKKPTPFNLYMASRMEALLALGITKDQVCKCCTKDFKVMSERQKLTWLLQALKRESVYKVFDNVILKKKLIIYC